jgi:DNA repair ATPase RecN
MTEIIENARLGYKQGARERETKKPPAKPTLSRVMGELDYDFAELLRHPPTKQETRFLKKDMQTLLQDLELADKGMQAIPGMEQKLKQIEGEMYEAMADKKPDEYNKLELSLRNEQKILNDIQVKVTDSIRAAKAYHENNPEDIRKSVDMLKTLRNELSSAYSYSEAKDNLPKLAKPVAQWLSDLKDKSSLDDRILAENVLKAGNVDYEGILTEVERQGLSLADRAIAEQRDKEAGRASTEKPQ